MLKLSRGRQIRTEAGPKAAGALMLKLSRGRQIRAEARPKAAGAREAEDVGEVKDGSNFKESDALRQIVTSQRLRSQKRHVESPKPLLLRCGSLCTRVRACQPVCIAELFPFCRWVLSSKATEEEQKIIQKNKELLDWF